MRLPFNKIGEFLNSEIVGKSVLKRMRSTTVTIDSRKVKKGDLFIAVKGEKFDGHDFINRELVNKASLLIVNKKWFKKKSFTEGSFIVVDDTVLAMLELAKNYLKHLSIKVIAVTGTNGKTTTRGMISKVLSCKYRVFETMGNYNNRIGLPLSVFKIDSKDEVAVLELGANHLKEIDELSKIVSPAISVITNIGKGHLEHFKTLNGVFRAKSEIVNGMNKRGTIVLNGDDPFLKKFKPAGKIERVLFGFNKNNDIVGKNFNSSILKGNEFQLNSGIKIASNFPGRGAAYNTLCALTVGKVLNVPFKSSVKVLKNIKIENNRMQIKRVKRAVFISDCYNANPDSLNNVLELVKNESGFTRKIAVIGDMGELGAKSVAMHRDAGKLIYKYGFNVLLTLGQLGKEVMVGAKKAGLENIFSFEKIEDIIGVISISLKKGDIVLVKGSRSMGMEIITTELIKREK